ncbi:unnamed protein product [Tuber aestivum]|uniref:Uncharacterized protein n=1 Tax=Tuber aestivum TaxID=59557 RepID=A0A292PWM7_9PEZI|nr:unnamed protein product [Tuber aestivum]
MIQVFFVCFHLFSLSQHSSSSPHLNQKKTPIEPQSRLCFPQTSKTRPHRSIHHIMQLSEESKERISKVLEISRVALHYGYLPFVLYLGTGIADSGLCVWAYRLFMQHAETFFDPLDISSGGVTGCDTRNGWWEPAIMRVGMLRVLN